MKRQAIAAHDLREGDVLLGDAVSPERYGQGVTVQVVNHDLGSAVLVLADGLEIELTADATVYIARRTS